MDDEQDLAELLALGLDTFVVDPDEQEWLGPRIEALLGIGRHGLVQARGPVHRVDHLPDAGG